MKIAIFLYILGLIITLIDAIKYSGNPPEEQTGKLLTTQVCFGMIFPCLGLLVVPILGEILGGLICLLLAWLLYPISIILTIFYLLRYWATEHKKNY